MATGQGFLSKAAFKKESGAYANVKAWGDAAGVKTLGVGDMVPMESESIQSPPTYLNDNSLSGKGGVAQTYKTAQNSAGSMSLQLQYENLDRLIALAMGFENPALDADGGSPHVVESGVYNHVYELDDIIHSSYWQLEDLASVKLAGSFTLGDKKVRRGTLGVAKQVNDWRWKNTMINQMTISGNPTDALKADFDVVSYDQNIGNYNSGAWTPQAASGVRILFSDMVFKIGQVGGALTEYGINNIQTRLNRKLANNQQDSSSGLYILEPLQNDFREVTGSIGIPRYINDDFQTILADASNYYKIEIDFIGQIISGKSTAYKLRIRFPKIKIIEGTPNVAGAEIIPQTYSFVAFRSDTTDFSYNATLVKKNEMTIETINTYSYNILREN